MIWGWKTWRSFCRRKRTAKYWNDVASHGELLRNFKDVGGLIHCPAEVRKDILKWLVLTYIGVQGGRTSWGNIRPVYYSDTAAPLVREIISESSSIIRAELRQLQKDKEIKRAASTDHIQRRFDSLLDLVEEDVEK